MVMVTTTTMTMRVICCGYVFFLLIPGPLIRTTLTHAFYGSFTAST